MYAIHKTTPYTIKRGMVGWPVWALQRGLNRAGIPTSEDSLFGSITEGNVWKFQQREGLGADGLAGPRTQKTLIQEFIPVAEQTAGLPDHLVDGFCAAEGGWLIAAVAWGSPGGVDCGAVQRRVYEVDYRNEPVVQRAFDTRYQIRLMCDRLRELHDIFLPRPGVGRNEQMAWKLAALNHNYPSAADRISRYGVGSLSSYWTTPQQWVVNIGAKFANGRAVRTPLEWCQFYALGNATYGHEGKVVQYVQDWTP